MMLYKILYIVIHCTLFPNFRLLAKRHRKTERLEHSVKGCNVFIV